MQLEMTFSSYAPVDVGFIKDGYSLLCHSDKKQAGDLVLLDGEWVEIIELTEFNCGLVGSEQAVLRKIT